MLPLVQLSNFHNMCEKHKLSLNDRNTVRTMIPCCTTHCINHWFQIFIIKPHCEWKISFKSLRRSSSVIVHLLFPIEIRYLATLKSIQLRIKPLFVWEFQTEPWCIKLSLLCGGAIYKLNKQWTASSCEPSKWSDPRSFIPYWCFISIVSLCRLESYNPHIILYI